MIVAKADKMAKMMNVPIIGIVENMSYVVCPDCGKKIEVFGNSHVDSVALDYGIPVLAKIPIDSKLTALCDRGMTELFENDYITAVADSVQALPKK